MSSGIDFRAENNITERPLIMLYRKIEKTNISYYIIKNTEIKEIIYMDLHDVPDEIKSKILDSTISDELSSSTSTTPI